MKLSSLSIALILALNMGSSIAAQDEKISNRFTQILSNKIESKGLFNFYQDRETGETLMLLTQDQLSSPYLYVASTLDGIADTWDFRGFNRENKIVEFRRYFDRIDVVTKTPRFLFDEQSPLSRSKDANISEAVLASLKIVSEEDGAVIINVDDLFLSEQLNRVSPWGSDSSGKQFQLGKLDTERSRILSKRLYDDNVDVSVEYVFINDNPSVEGSKSLSDRRIAAIKIQHSFIKLQGSSYIPRRDDARVGYFAHQFDRMTSQAWTPYQDIIVRWDLQKQDPLAALSEPKKPIVWWIENTTPYEWRDTIRDAVLTWNKAFEKIGIKNAIQVNVQPDDASWDAGDINYNVLRWISSPVPLTNGYGFAVSNPLTGEALGADVILEFNFAKRTWASEQMFEQQLASSGTGSSGKQAAYRSCLVNQQLQQGMLMAEAQVMGSEAKRQHMLKQGLRMLVMHEIGHTLGLTHNMKASTLWDEKQVHNPELTKGVVTSSVMDYAPINFAPIGIEQGDYFQTELGPYDHWAIEYGYSIALEDKSVEALRLNKLLSRSSEPALSFGNDADMMRSSGKAIDPLIMTGDMSSNPVAYAIDRMELINQTLAELKTHALVEGESYQQLLASVKGLYAEYRNQAKVISRQIGGVSVDRSFVNSHHNTQPYTPVDIDTQTRAMSALSQYVFSPETLVAIAPLYGYMQHQRRGFDHSGKNEDPKGHKTVLKLQTLVLSHLLHADVLQRVSDTELYGNKYDINRMLTELTAAIFIEEKSLKSTTRNLQIEYVQRLIKVVSSEGEAKYGNLAKAAASYQLMAIKDRDGVWGADDVTQAHKAYVDFVIAQAFKA